MSIVDALAAPMYAILDTFGSGEITTAGVDEAIATLRTQLESVGAQTRSVNVTVGHTWTGPDAGAAQRSLGRGATSAEAIGEHTQRISTSMQSAADAVRQGHAQLKRIVDSFVRQGNAANPTLTNPAGLIAVLTLAAEHLQQALDVLQRTRQQLDGETGTVAGLAEQTPSAPGTVSGPGGAAGAQTTPASAGATTTPQLAQGASGTGSGSSGTGGGLGSALSAVPTAPTTAGGTSARGGTSAGSTRSGTDRSATARQVSGPARIKPRTTLGGVEVTLPDGRVVIAPNAQAAAAVRAALTQLGVPYSWGGTSPGQGLDCSGLTQWAYRQAGIELPRLAQEQHIGMRVSADQLMPGDLAVWDGHVAMVIGDGRMVEAREPNRCRTNCEVRVPWVGSSRIPGQPTPGRIA